MNICIIIELETQGGKGPGSAVFSGSLGDEQGSSLKSACIFQRNKSICLCHCLLRKCYCEEYLMQYIPIYWYLCDILLNIKANGRMRCMGGVMAEREVYH